jgi:phosphohistidine phosphatase SixA
MKFVLFRHAHKGVQPFEDPELSLPGFEQAARLTGMISAQQLPVPTKLWVSPRRRTSQTFYPVSRGYSIPLEIKDELDQCSEETGSEFRKRIQSLLNEIDSMKLSAETVFACTHYDWIEHAMQLIHCDRDLNTFEFSHWSPTQFVEFDITAAGWTFVKKGAAK